MDERKVPPPCISRKKFDLSLPAVQPGNHRPSTTMKKIQSQSNTNLIYGNPAVQIPNKMKPRVQVLKSSDDGSDQASQGGDGTLSHLASCLNAFLCWKWSRTVALRVLFVTSIIFAIFICSLVSYLIIRDLEDEVGHQSYESVAASALKAAREITLRKYQAAKVMESVLSFAFPDAEMWPYVGLNGYFHTSREVAALASTGSMGMSVFVQPPEAAAFESFIQEHFDQQGYPPDAGLSDFGFGIYTRDPDSPFADGRVPSRTGNDTSYGGSPYTILAPIMDHSMWNTNALMYDVHSTDTAVDALFECTEHATQNSDFLATMTDAPTAPQKPACTVSTGFKKLISRPDLATLVDQPIYPANDPTTVVGFVGTSIQWIEVLDQIVPDFFDTLVAVISTDSQWHSNTDFDTVTYIIRHGHAVFLGEGDQHDRRFDSSARSIVLNDVTGATKSVHVTLTVYPNSFDQFATKSPLAVSLGFAAVIAICTVIFFVYDFLVQSDINERKVVLEMKRRFVRFISHEIRTPLNTVCMGLELLESELGPHRDRNVTPEASSSSLAPESSSGASVDYWYDITRDIQENASSAVGILNELLKYDKIETGNLELEIGQVLMWDLVAKVVSQFRLQAVNKEVDLSFTITDNHSDRDPEVGEGMVSESLRELVVVGDPMRLSEVVRNVISNALKFTPIGGLIKVSVEYKKDGLPEKRSWGRKRNFQLTSNSTDQIQASDQSTGDSNSLACFYSFPRAGSILISVTDTGVGMSEHQLSRVFVEGVQFNANRLQAGGGSGLGLCISKGIIERHRGAIVASSAGEGKGCTFSVELPLYDSSCDQFKTESLVSEKLPTMADSADTCPDKVAPTGTGSMAVDMETVPTIEDDRGLEASSTPQEKQCLAPSTTPLGSTRGSSVPAPPPSTPSKAETQKHTVLVVDDVLSNRKMLVRLLERAGHQCFSACDGQEAIDTVVANRKAATSTADAQSDEGTIAPDMIDTVLMDYEMPVKNGPDATFDLRQLGFKGAIIGVTGNVLHEDVDYFKKKGANDVLPKPVSMKLLKDYWATHQTGSRPPSSEWQDRKDPRVHGVGTGRNTGSSRGSKDVEQSVEGAVAA